MIRIMLALCLAAFLSTSEAGAFDLPGGIELQFGFKTFVMPAPNDTSRALGLGVAIHKVISDSTSNLNISGTITNFSSVPCDGIEMHFAVTSYIGSSTSPGRAIVTPDSLPPGGTATFVAYISLYSEKPRNAMYTITARTPPCCPEAVPVAAPIVAETVPEITVPEGEAAETGGEAVE